MKHTQELNTQEQEIPKALAASDMYQILSIFLRLPTELLATGLLDGSLAKDVCTIMSELELPDQDIEKINNDFLFIQESIRNKEVLLTEMKREYTRLFTHPKEPVIQIYETLFFCNPEEDEGRPSLFISPAAIDAERCYKGAGLSLSPQVREPADHMATEMEFMMYLYQQKAIALQESNSKEITRREDEIQEFTEIHLKKWAPNFFKQCISCSKNTVYHVFGKIGKIYMDKILPC